MTTSLSAGNVTRRDQSGLQPRFRRYAALRDFRSCFCQERNLGRGGKIQRVGKSIKYVLALAHGPWALSPVGHTFSSQNDDRGFLVRGIGPIDVARLQAPYEKAHPLPCSLLPGQVQQFSRLLRRQRAGVDQEIAVFQVGTFTQGSFVSSTCSKRYDTMAKACWDCQRALLERILPLVKPPDEFVITLIWPSHFPVRLVILVGQWVYLMRFACTVGADPSVERFPGRNSI